MSLYKVFPFSQKYQAETPVWLRLGYYEYENYFNNRHNGTPYIGDPSITYWLPLPANVGTGTKIQASDDASLLSVTRTGMLDPSKSYVRDRAANAAGPNVERQPPPHGSNPAFLWNDESYEVNRGGLAITRNQFTYGVGIAGMFGRIGPGREAVISEGKLATTGNNSEGYVDIQDTAWYGQNKKQFNFNLNLKSKSIEDSDKASIICNDFSNLILPSIDPTNVQDRAIYNQRVTHPGVWEIRAVSQVNVDVTDLWLGKYPQPCLLMEVDAVRVGNQAQGSINGMINASGSRLFPIQYTLFLRFQEIEPSYVFKGSYNNIAAYRRSRFLNDC